MVAREMLPLKVRISTGSDTSGEKVSQARSFQYVSLRRGSRPLVEKDSTVAMTNLPLEATGRWLYGIVIRGNQFVVLIRAIGDSAFAPGREALRSPQAASRTPLGGDAVVRTAPLQEVIGYALRRAQGAVYSDLSDALARISLRPLQYT